MNDNALDILDEIIYILSSNTPVLEGETTTGFIPPTAKEILVAKKLTALLDELKKGEWIKVS